MGNGLLVQNLLVCEGHLSFYLILGKLFFCHPPA
jgi:hypothetical protein